jgi:hypothetical protein
MLGPGDGGHFSDCDVQPLYNAVDILKEQVSESIHRQQLEFACDQPLPLT